MILKGSIAKSEKIIKFLSLGFQYVATDINGSLKICSSYLVHSQIWLNLHMDDSHFSTNIFLCITATQATLKYH
jgi:hypothetical protein